MTTAESKHVAQAVKNATDNASPYTSLGAEMRRRLVEAGAISTFADIPDKDASGDVARFSPDELRIARSDSRSRYWKIFNAANEPVSWSFDLKRDAQRIVDYVSGPMPRLAWRSSSRRSNERARKPARESTKSRRADDVPERVPELGALEYREQHADFGNGQLVDNGRELLAKLVVFVVVDCRHGVRRLVRLFRSEWRSQSGGLHYKRV